MSGHRPATVRRAGRKRGARFESTEALAEQPAVARSAVELSDMGTCPVRMSLPPVAICQFNFQRRQRGPADIPE